jgi:hypothetical protein
MGTVSTTTATKDALVGTKDQAQWSSAVRIGGVSRGERQCVRPGPPILERQLEERFSCVAQLSATRQSFDVGVWRNEEASMVLAIAGFDYCWFTARRGVSSHAAIGTRPSRRIVQK